MQKLEENRTYKDFNQHTDEICLEKTWTQLWKENLKTENESLQIVGKITPLRPIILEQKSIILEE